MKTWPVPNSYSKKLPEKGTLGSFWENRGDRHHTGVDIFAPPGSEVVACDSGYVIDVGEFQVPEKSKYINKSYFVSIKTEDNFIYKYAELSEVYVNMGDYVLEGTPIGQIDIIINPENLDYKTPDYIFDMVDDDRLSMLHLEIYLAPITEVKPYESGNFLGDEKPYSLIDPGFFLDGSRRKNNKE
jgi:hypothetical protein